MGPKCNLPKTFLEPSPSENAGNPIWLATSFKLHRNVAKSLFPPKMDPAAFQKMLGMLKDTMLNCPLLQGPILLKAEELSPFDKEYLLEHFFDSEGFQNTLAGQGFIIDNTRHFFAKINIENHLQIQLIDFSGNWEKTWNVLNQMEADIGAHLAFAFLPKFGYLTAHPFLCGTGLIVEAYLHLPALIHTHALQEVLLQQKEEGVSVTGLGGNLEDWVGDLVVVKNIYTLGVNEESILQSVHSMAMKLIAIEKTLRSQLQSENNGEIKDQISRSFGLLLHSYQLQAKEALGALSLMRLGISLNWVDGISDAKLSSLFFQSQRAHLLHTLGELQLTDSQDIARKRAEFFHKSMQGVVLKT